MLAPWPLALSATTLKAIIINDSDQPGFLLTSMDENGRNTMATSMVVSEGGPKVPIGHLYDYRYYRTYTLLFKHATPVHQPAPHTSPRPGISVHFARFLLVITFPFFPVSPH